MSGLLGTRAAVASDLNLLLQIIVLVILLVGVRYGRKKTGGSLKTHGRLMNIVVVLNAVGVLLVMLPSFVNNLGAVIAEPSTIGFPLTSVHVLFGSVAEVLGIILAFRKFGNVRVWMRLTTVFWLIALALGITFYVRYYVI